MAAPVRERHDDFDVAAGKVVFLSDEAGHSIGVESHEQADRSGRCVDFDDLVRSAVELSAANMSDDLLPGVALPPESVPDEQLRVEQVLLATDRGQAIGCHRTRRPGAQGDVGGGDVSFVADDDLVVDDGVGQRLQDGAPPRQTHPVAGEVVDGDDGEVRGPKRRPFRPHRLKGLPSGSLRLQEKADRPGVQRLQRFGDPAAEFVVLDGRHLWERHRCVSSDEVTPRGRALRGIRRPNPCSCRYRPVRHHLQA